MPRPRPMRQVTYCLVKATNLAALGVAYTLAFFLATPNARASTDYPNIIYILVDDLGYGDVNLQLEGTDSFQNPHVQTPRLAQLAEESLVFTHHYAASPVCSPSRAGLLTGRIPTRMNINQYISDKDNEQASILLGDEFTLAELLKSQGYQTAIFGKWHLNGADWEDPSSWEGWTGSFPKQQGFETGFVSKEDPHYSRRLMENTQKHPGDFFSVEGVPIGPIKGYTSDIISNAAVDWLKTKRNRSQPFFLFLPYDAVHVRIMAADKYEALYNTGDPRRDAYYANITHLDAAIGNLLDYLKESGLESDTLVFFSSDNGPDVNGGWHPTLFSYGTSYPLFGQKYQLYEGGIRVPGMVRWPNRITPRISTEPNSTLDVLPTLAELTSTELSPDREIDGESMLGLLLENQSFVRDKPLYWQYDYPREYTSIVGKKYERQITLPHAPNRTFHLRSKIRLGRYTLHGLSDRAFTKPTEFSLHDILKDPEEQTDIGSLMPARFEEMKGRLLEMFEHVENDRQKTIHSTEKLRRN